jgi:hypothetical protein
MLFDFDLEVSYTKVGCWILKIGEHVAYAIYIKPRIVQYGQRAGKKHFKNMAVELHTYPLAGWRGGDETKVDLEQGRRVFEELGGDGEEFYDIARSLGWTDILGQEETLF